MPHPCSNTIMKVSLGLVLVFCCCHLLAQTPDSTSSSDNYSGMYTFLQEGEFVQVTVEDEGRVTGFISRFGDGESDRGAFLDQFFKEGKLDGQNLTFATRVVHGVSYTFKGVVQRGPGKTSDDEAYYLLKGSLTESHTDTNKKSYSKSRDVVFKSFPKSVDSAPAPRN